MKKKKFSFRDELQYNYYSNIETKIWETSRRDLYFTLLETKRARIDLVDNYLDIHVHYRILNNIKNPIQSFLSTFCKEY